VERIAAVCRRHDVPLAAAALQFPLGHPAVVSVIPGPITPEEVRQNLAGLSREIPGTLWTDLKKEGLIVSDAPIKP
jgi:D-threo-aldose 1-dehydrogenase